MPSILWSNPMQVNDVAVSKEGKYLAAVNNTGVYFFASTSTTAKWWCLAALGEDFLSVAISKNGSYLVVGNNSRGRISYFAHSSEKNGLVTPTWTSVYLGSNVEKRTLDISDNGEYVSLGGTGENTYYFAGCTGRSGSEQSWTWRDKGPTGWGALNDIHAVDMSSDGKYIAVGGSNYTGKGSIIFYKNAYNGSGLNWTKDLTATFPLVDVAVSDDGYGVASVDNYLTSFDYWKNANTLTGHPLWSFSDGRRFSSVDMSADGNATVAGSSDTSQSFQHLVFWKGFKIGSPTSWGKLYDEKVEEVAISEDGSIVAASTENITSLNHRVYFFASDGTEIGRVNLLQDSPFMSMSGDGTVVAVGGPGVDSLDVIVLKSPVGGEILSDNLPQLLMPYLLVAAVIMVGAAAAILKKRRL